MAGRLRFSTAPFWKESSAPGALGSMGFRLVISDTVSNSSLVSVSKRMPMSRYLKGRAWMPKMPPTPPAVLVASSMASLESDS